MKIDLEPGKYVVAVSGGVDSMVLLHLLAAKPGCQIIVAHFDHGIREDSGADRQLVEATAAKFGLECVSDEAALGPGASEEMARNARYGFLFRVLRQHGADAIITAHHQDDLIETAFINLHRGTGRRGLTALQSRPQVLRPLLSVPKQELVTYAREHNIVWHEDSTNAEERYLRNYLRRQAVQKLSPAQRAMLLEQIQRLQHINHDLDQELVDYLQKEQHADRLDRHRFNLLPEDIAREVMAFWLRGHGILGFDKKTLQRLVAGAHTLEPGKQVEIVSDHKLLIRRDFLALNRSDR